MQDRDLQGLRGMPGDRLLLLNPMLDLPVPPGRSGNSGGAECGTSWLPGTWGCMLPLTVEAAQDEALVGGPHILRC
jgi:hypothetical protein